MTPDFKRCLAVLVLGASLMASVGAAATPAVTGGAPAALPMAEGAASDSAGAAVTDDDLQDGLRGTFRASSVGKPTPQSPSFMGGRAPQAAKICTFIQRVDWVHISSTSKKRAAQSHGNWDNVDCSYKQADVTTQIDRRNPLLLFEAVGKQGKGRLGPNKKGLGSGAARVTAHYDCNGKAKADFRSWTSVDIVGYADAPNRVHSSPQPLSCG